MTLRTPGVADAASRSCRRCSGSCPLADQEALQLDSQQYGDGCQQHPDTQRADPVPDGVAGDVRQHDRSERQREAGQGPEVLQQNNGEFRAPAAADELPPVLLAAQRPCLA